MNQPADLNRERVEPVAAAVATHGRWLRTVLAARGVDRDGLDDAMQIVSAEALRNAERVRDAEKLAPWLYRIAIRQALQYRRRTGRRRKLTERYSDSGLAPSEAMDADPLAWLLAEEQQQLVRRAIAAMPTRDAEILLLKYTEEWSYREIAERLGTSPAAVEARLHRARGKLRTTLARLAPDLIPQR
jgi:RNA polymerase sigma-70 factor (ECF subfamily)